MSNHTSELSRRRLLASGTAVSAAAIAGCIGGSDGDGSTLLFTQEKGWGYGFDPIVSNGVPSTQINGQIYEALYTYNEDATNSLVPELADGEPDISDDGTTWTATIKDEATFQNGDDVTAEDVKYSFEAPVDEKTENAGELNMIESIEAVDDKTVKFTLEYPYAAFNTTIGWPIVPKSEREGSDDFGHNPVGSGPFQWVEWEEGQYVLLESWDDYWGEQTPDIEQVEFNFVTEQSTRVTGLKTGESDIIEGIPPQLWEDVKGMSNASIKSSLGIGYFYLGFNCNEGPTADPQVREAVDYSFSMDDAVESFVEPAGVRQYSPFPQSIVDAWDFPTDQWEEIPHDRDLDQAKQLFNDAGISMDYEWNIIVPPDEMRKAIGQSVSSGLKEVGFTNVTFESLEWGTFLDLYKTGNEDDYNMFTLGWSGSPDPEAYTYYLFAQEQEGVTNGTFYHNDEVDQQIIDAREDPDKERRREMYIDSVTTILEDRVHLPSYNTYNSYGVSDSVSNFKSHPDSGTIPLSTDYTNVGLK
ncbi:ABC transporter substrate-binding protein [Natrinema sp. J7-2]|uniref:ABC transporter substrate-binding protein n=1 Tax=Natrinema sp. (strain J7-2) TaxID=406552 RepID=UPI00026D490A|nr:ABC transporter substrate-binding protein [Natrinema sp. J7-2]AFO55650.1 family 5 extracellular solute-binding protein [Natrinema sp. J7-2]